MSIEIVCSKVFFKKITGSEGLKCRSLDHSTFWFNLV